MVHVFQIKRRSVWSVDPIELSSKSPQKRGWGGELAGGGGKLELSCYMDQAMRLQGGEDAARSVVSEAKTADVSEAGDVRRGADGLIEAVAPAGELRPRLGEACVDARQDR